MGKDPTIRLLDDLSFDMIPRVYHLIASPNKKVARQAITKICSLDGFDSFPRLLRLDRRFRQFTSLTWSIVWRRVPLSRYAPDFISREEQLKLVGLASFHPSGYYRSKAIDYIAKNPESFFIPYLILRINDWVAEVRKKSLKVLQDMVRRADTTVLLRYLSAIEHMDKFSRYDSGQLKKEINGLIIKNATDGEYEELLKHPDEKIRRSIVTLLINNNRFTPRIVTVILETERVPHNRFLLYDHLKKTGWQYNWDGTSTYLQKERWYRTKLLLLNLLIEMDGERLEELLIQHLTDRSSRIRAFVRSELADRFHKDCRSTYLKNIAELRKLRYSIIGLSEFGDRTDIPVIRNFLTNADVTLVDGALIGLSNLGENRSFQELKPFLYNRIVSTSSIATRILKGRIHRAESDEVSQSMSNDLPAHVYTNLMKLLRDCPKWDSIFYFVSFIDHNCTAVRHLSASGMSKWITMYNRSYSRPSIEQVKRLETALAAKQAVLNEKYAELLAFTVRMVKNTAT